MDRVRYKVLLEGVKVPVSAITRRQEEGSPARLTLRLWPTSSGAKIAKGTSVVVFRWEDDPVVLTKLDDKFPESGKRGVWLLFFDGYIDQSPLISRRETHSLEVSCVQWSERLNTVFIRSRSIGEIDLGSTRDKAFMGIGGMEENPNPYFTDSIIPGDALLSIKNMIAGALGGVGAALLNLVKLSVNYDELYARVVAVNELNRRFFSVENKLVTGFLARETLLDVMSRQVENMPTTTSLYAIINKLMLQVLYTASMVPSPMIDDNGLHQFVYKPQLFFAPPMKCNIIFPTSVEMMEPVRSRYDQPTRVAFIGQSRQLGDAGDRFTPKIFFPDKLGQIFNTIEMGDYDYMKFEKKYTDEELIQERIVPSFSGLPFQDSTLNADTTPKSVHGLSSILGRYSYYLEANSTNPLSLTLDFDPWLVCGYSSYVIDEKFGYVLGRLRTITDIININDNTEKTIVEMVNIRVVDDMDAASSWQIPGYNDLFGIEDAGESGAFFDESLNNENIDETLHVPHFGCKSIINDDDGYWAPPNPTVLLPEDKIPLAMRSIKKAAQGVSGEYFRKFLWNFKKRPIATEGEYMAFLGARVNDKEIEDKYASSDKYDTGYGFTDKAVFEGTKEATKTNMIPFMKERQDIILGYIEDIKRRHLADHA